MQTSTQPRLIHSTNMRFVVTAFAMMLMLGSCAKRTDVSTSDTTHSASTYDSTHTAATTDTGMRSTSTTSQPSTMTDANIFAKLSEADSSEITLAKLVKDKLKSADAKSFASMMIADHTKLKNAGAALAKKLGITPTPPAGDNTPSELATRYNTMSGLKGADLDKAYIDDAVDDHQKDLSSLKDWQAAANAPELKKAIADALPVVQKHLDHAKSIQQKLSAAK